MVDNGIEQALKAIDPVARAMLDLSIRRRLPDPSIAELAQMPSDELERWRDDVLDKIGRQIGLTGPNARDRVRAELLAVDSSAWVESEEAAPKRSPRRTAPQGTAPRRPSRGLIGTLALLALLVVAVVIASLSSSDDSGPDLPTTTRSTTSERTTTTESTTTESTTTTTSTPTTPGSEPVALTPLPGMPDTGKVTASVSQDGDKRRLVVELDGLPEPGNGVYELWLYNALIGARSLGTTDSGDGSIAADLPADADSFQFLDLSRERGPSDRVHSGISVRRVELAPLLASLG